MDIKRKSGLVAGKEKPFKVKTSNAAEMDKRNISSFPEDRIQVNLLFYIPRLYRVCIKQKRPVG